MPFIYLAPIGLPQPSAMNGEEWAAREADRRNSLNTYTGEEDEVDSDRAVVEGFGPQASVARSPRNTNDKFESEILWCNGRCMGRADTDTCTLLCLGEWEKKVKTTQHQLNIKHIIEKHHHSDLVLKVR